jgi:hypothetical protein
MVSREVRQARLLPGLVSILRTVAVVRDEQKKESKERTACSAEVQYVKADYKQLTLNRSLALPHMSEIDKIFAAKRIADPQPSIAPSKSKKKRKHKSTRPQSDAPGSDPPSDRKKRPEPETVVDPSSDINPKRQKLDRTNVPPKSKSKRSDKDDEKTFKDSRGSAARKGLLSWLPHQIRHV